MFKIIVAMCKYNGIGFKNTMPWPSIHEDMKTFAKKTKGNNNNAIIMGRKTWNSLPKKPLSNRFNIILSKTLNINDEKTKTFDNLGELIDYCKNSSFNEIWVIGGEEIYKLLLPYSDTIHVTYINEYYVCDTFFPNIPDNFLLSEKQELKSNLYVNIYKKQC